MCVLSLAWKKSHAYLSHDGHMIKENAATQHVSRVALRTRAARVVHAGIDCLLVMPDHLDHNIGAPAHNQHIISQFLNPRSTTACEARVGEFGVVLCA